MARGDKNYDKVTHGLDGKSAEEKKKALHKMVEALINGKDEEASQHLHSYLNIKTREILVGEAEESDESEKDEEKEEEKEEKADDKEEKEDDKDEEKEDDKKEEKVEETVNHHPEGAMSRKVQGDIKFANGGKKTVLKHNNSAPGLEPEVKGDVKFKGSGKKSGALKHGNSAPGLEDEVKSTVKV